MENKVLIDRKLLEEAYFELVRIDCEDLIWEYGDCGPGCAEVFYEDIETLDYSMLIDQISEVLGYD